MKYGKFLPTVQLLFRNLYRTKILHNSTVQYSTVQYSTVQYSTVQYSTVQYSTVQYSTVQYNTVQYKVQVQCSTVMHYYAGEAGKNSAAHSK